MFRYDPRFDSALSCERLVREDKISLRLFDGIFDELLLDEDR